MWFLKFLSAINKSIKYSSTVNNFNFLIQFAFDFWLRWSHSILFKSKSDQKIGWKIASSDRTYKESLLIAD